MIASIGGYVNSFNEKCVKPTIEWSKKHELLIAGIGISVILGIACYRSPEVFEFTKKNIKLLTVVVPIACTILPLPIVAITVAISGGANGRGGGSISDVADPMFKAYYYGVIKVWQEWFKFVGIPVIAP